MDTDARPGDVELGRRRFVGYLVAAPTLAVAVRLGADSLAAGPAAAVVPSLPSIADEFDLSDLLKASSDLTAGMITLQVHKDGSIHFALPRSENGQGITTSTAMLIAEEIDAPMSHVKVTLSPARPELMYNQLTGGSNTTFSTYHPIRTAAAIARQRLVKAAAKKWGVAASTLRTSNGYVVRADGARLSYGALATLAAAQTATRTEVTLKSPSEFKVIGKPHKRIDARQAVTGEKKFAMDLQVPGALPVMVCRPPTVNGKVVKVNNAAAVRQMSGVTHVVPIKTGVAVRARTFGQCITAIRALDVTWATGTIGTKSDADILKEVRAAEVPLVVPQVPVLAKTIDTDFTFWFAGNSSLETNCCVADVREDRAEVWGPFKTPNAAKGAIAQITGLPASKVTVNVIGGGGSFGRKLFFDAALEAAEASKKMKAPVRLMWHRVDDVRQGRVHPMATSRIRATVLGNDVLTWEQRHTSVKTDYSHGLGEVITGMSAKLPIGDKGWSETVYTLSQQNHYNFGVTTNLFMETESGFNTSSMRNIYSPNAAVARELTVDKIAKVMGKDRLDFRREFAYDKRSQAVLTRVAAVGGWGRSMPPGHAQGIAIHNEYKAATACLVEIDCTPATVNRKIRDAYTGPRVTKVVFAVDIGQVVNPTGLEAQMMGGIMDGIALALTSSLHLRDGYFAEASWDNYCYTREWHVPPKVQVIIMPSTSETPGGAGELGVPASCAAVAAAYAEAMGKTPTEFPVNYRAPLFFDVKPRIPSIPQSPTNGLTFY